MDDVYSGGERKRRQIFAGQSHGIVRPIAQAYQYPEWHPCCGCHYTFQTNVPSCIFWGWTDGGCFWHDLKDKKKQDG